jgi:outer membrane protein
MKKSIIAILMLGTAFTASADVVLGADVELGYWNQSSSMEVLGVTEDQGDESNLIGSISFEHVVPMIPNIKYSFSKIDNNAFEYSKNDATLYYEILDNDLVSIDIGAGVTQISSGNIALGDFDFEGYLPHVYAGAEFGIPTTGLTVYTDVSAVALDDSSLVDATVGVRYDISLIAVEIGLQAGYKMVEFNVEDFDALPLDYNMKTDGFFFGVNLDF